MNVVVITGSTRGLGRALAAEFLARGCAVVVCGRAQGTVDAAVQELAAASAPERVFGQACDTADFAQVQALWDAAVARFGHVDFWIQNAGLAAPMAPFWEVEAGDLKVIADANLLGGFYGSRVALAGMVKQGSGALYLLEGFGSDGSLRKGLTPYATTKAALRYLARALAAETKKTGVRVGSINPGIMITDLLMQNVEPGQRKSAERVFNILGDRVETVAPWIVERVLAGTKSGERIAWLTTRKVYARFLAAPFRKRKVID